MPNQESSGKLSGAKTVRVKWGDSSKITTLYSNELHITHTGSEFFITFGEVAVPPGGIDEVEELDIVPVARIAVTTGNMERFYNAIKSNMERFLDKVEDGD